MKIFITVLLAFLSFSDGQAVPLDPTVVKDPGPHATNVSVNVAWAFNSGINITVVEMSVNNLKSLQYAALGLGQHQAMVNIKEYRNIRCLLCPTFNSLKLLYFLNCEVYVWK
jgi:hypothetical protein